jgi:Xaa-Pro aminopeptidase
MRSASSAGEIGARCAAARESLGAAQLDALLIGAGPNLQYFTGYPSPASGGARPFLFLLPRDGDPVLIVHAARRLEAARFAQVEDVRVYEGLGHLPQSILAEAVRDRHLASGRIGLEWGGEMRSDLPTHKLLEWAWQFPRMQLVDGAAVIWSQRLVKSAAEAACIREACAITSAAFERLFRTLHEGMTEADVMQAFAQLQIQGGAAATWGSITSGPGNYELPSKPPTTRQLRRGDLIWVDGGCAVGGYWSDFSRAAVVGDASDAQRRTQDAINHVTAATIALLRPGTPLATVASACYRLLAATRLPATAQISTLAERVGHGLGLNTAEPPSLAVADGGRVLPGMVLTVEPAVATAYGIFHHEQNLLITDEGVELLSSAPVELGRVD